MIRVLLVDDSIVQREILRRLLGSDDTFTIVGEARNGKEALHMVEEHRPDVVLMDIHMPEMDGVEATREIMRRFPVPIVIASATLKKRDIDVGLAALEAGAFSVIAKPEGAVLLNLSKIARKLRDELLAAAKVKLKPAPRGPLPSREDRRPTRSMPPSPPSDKVEVIGICTSTGGPPVLIEILSALPRPYSIPVLLIQHITQGFEENFAAWLTQRSGQPVGMALDGQRLSAGVWMAPNGAHLTLKNSRYLGLVPQKSSDIHCPSGNPLFGSLAIHLGRHAAGFLLTGMGDDGAQGLLELKRAGGMTVIQEELSCFIWGMPKVAKEMHAANHELNPREIALLMAAMEKTGVKD